MSNAGLFNHAMPDGTNTFIAQPSLLAQPSLPFQFNTQDHQAADNIQQYLQAGPVPQPAVFPLSLPRRYRDEDGKFQVPGLKDLPHGIQSRFRDTFIRHIMKLIFAGTSPWSNPTLAIYQREFAAIYPDLPYEIHADDALVLPVSVSRLKPISTCRSAPNFFHFRPIVISVFFGTRWVLMVLL